MLEQASIGVFQMATQQSQIHNLALDEQTSPLPLSTRLFNLIAIVAPVVGLVTGCILVWGSGFGWVQLSLLVAMYLLTGMGITVGYHRLFTHRSFETYRSVQFVLAALGSMAAQGPLLRWVAMHRCHHQHSDQPGDPHSPHLQGQGIGGLFRGLWHAHLGWVFQPDPAGLDHYVKDLRKDTPVRVASALFPVWVVLGLLVPAVLGGLFTMSWWGALLGFLWGGLARICLVHHVTWSVNSACHFWGRRPFPVPDESRNNFLFGLLALGEGWHNNHHAFPTSAPHGLRWWQIDLGFWFICMLALLHLAWGLRRPQRSVSGAQSA
jgi:stearoyl-CoA desaturase (delta-9 desaturase)